MEKKRCLLCNKILVKGQTKFCCQNHCNQYKKEESIKKWLSGEDEGWSGTNIKHFVRDYLLQKSNYKCEKCGWGERNIYSNTIPLEIHHIDGNYKNNKLENLQVLCPNCHSLTNTYKSLNQDSLRNRTEQEGRKKIKYCIDCGKEIFYESTRCLQCENKNRAIPLEKMVVTRDELKNLIRTTSFVKIGQQYNVSDNTIRKWCDKFNLPRKASEIKNYSDEEWEKI